MKRMIWVLASIMAMFLVLGFVVISDHDLYLKDL